jgi:hypothetical protein
MSKEKRPSIAQIFADRMRREGKHEAFRADQHHRLAQGDAPSVALWGAMREFGYTTPKREREFYDDYLFHVGETTAQQSVKDREGLSVDLERVTRGLPPSAPPSVELEWIGAHPAMRRKYEQKNPNASVLITSKDVVKSPLGKAPSVRAVNQLVHWANNLDAWYKMIGSEHKKSIVAEKDPEAKEDTLDPGLKDIRDYLDSLEDEGPGEDTGRAVV